MNFFKIKEVFFFFLFGDEGIKTLTYDEVMCEIIVDYICNH